VSLADKTHIRTHPHILPFPHANNPHAYTPHLAEMHLEETQMPWYLKPQQQALTGVSQKGNISYMKEQYIYETLYFMSSSKEFNVV